MNQSKRVRRDIDGILLFDKPIGVSSNGVLQQIKHLFNASKAGHTGSLDPLASGMLPICFGEATKFSTYLLNANKSYEVIAKLGVTTTTSDAEGDVVATREVPTLDEGQIERVLDHFRGQSSQVPSIYSALKHQGRPLYSYARQGIEVPIAARNITIFKLDLIEKGSDFLRLFVTCSKGTYIRTLVQDIGEILGCGAHVSFLRRTQVAGFPSSQMMTWDQLTQLNSEQQLSCLLTLEEALPEWPLVGLSAIDAQRIRQGQIVKLTDLPIVGLVRLVNAANQFIGIGELDEQGLLRPKRLIKQAQPETQPL